MKRRLTIARSLINRPGHPAARRADHRPRPAGPPRAVGPAVPAQAAGRHPGHHDALHGRGRAAVRPARRDGQRRDRRRGLAARPDPRALHPRGGRAPVPGRRPRRHGARRSPTSATGSRCCPTASWSTATTASTCSSRCTSAACARSPPWYAAPPSRTSSSGSPAGRWWTDGDHRGHRLVRDDDRLSVWRGMARQYDYWLTVYKRTWKGVGDQLVRRRRCSTCSRWACCSAVSSTWRPSELEGATSYLAFVVPGLIAAQAMQTAVCETTYPVMGAIKWHKSFYAQLASPARGARPRQRHADVHAVPGGLDLRRLLPGDGAVRRLRDLVGPGARLARPRCSSGMAFATWTFAFSAHVDSDATVRADLPARPDPAVPLLRRVLPDQQPRPRAASGSPS